MLASSAYERAMIIQKTWEHEAQTCSAKAPELELQSLMVSIKEVTKKKKRQKKPNQIKMKQNEKDL